MENTNLKQLEKIKHLLILSTNSHKNQDKDDLIEALCTVDELIKEQTKK